MWPFVERRISREVNRIQRRPASKSASSRSWYKDRKVTIGPKLPKTIT